MSTNSCMGYSRKLQAGLRHRKTIARLRGDLSADVLVGRQPETEMERSGIEVTGL